VKIIQVGRKISWKGKPVPHVVERSRRCLTGCCRGTAGRTNQDTGRHPLLSLLTAGEFQVLGTIVEGKDSKEIAVPLSLAVQTVRSSWHPRKRRPDTNRSSGWAIRT
jgi:FixJ family two-component response regulator